MIRMALEKGIPDSDFSMEEFFGLRIPNSVEGVPDEILHPFKTWQDKEAYRRTAADLIEKMRLRMQRFQNVLDPAILNAGPVAQ